VNVTPITVVPSIDRELHENLIDMEKIDTESVDDSTDKNVMEFLEFTQEHASSVTAEFVLCAAKDETSVEFMRPLLNSWAECSVVISCGKVDYDKSG
jgi:hypothetical protein